MQRTDGRFSEIVTVVAVNVIGHSLFNRWLFDGVARFLTLAAFPPVGRSATALDDQIGTATV